MSETCIREKAACNNTGKGRLRVSDETCRKGKGVAVHKLCETIKEKGCIGW